MQNHEDDMIRDETFTPILYLKAGCPHCLKVRIFLLEARLLETVAIREFTPDTTAEAAIRGELDGRFAKTTFPTAQIAPGAYLADSAEIVAAIADSAGIDPAALPVYTAYVEGIYARHAACRRELASLKAGGV